MTTIRTAFGPVRGVARSGVLQFRGVRFGEPPTGDRRFRPAELASAWTHPYDATAFPPRAAQPLDDGLLAVSGPMAEDCLFVNVYTPAADGAGRPVLVWFHGGGNTGGGANDNDGSVLARQGDLVVVCVNYRLGFFGFLDLRRHGDEYAASASLGYLDQRLALDWVQATIADYGGDPGNVTLMGESAGAAGVLAQLALEDAPPDAAGRRFHRAIASSPGGISAPPVDTHRLAARGFGVDEADLLDTLRVATTEDVVDAQVRSGLSLAGGFDGTVITGPVPDILRRRGHAVPLIVGSNRDEGTLFTVGVSDDPEELRRTRRAVARNVTFGGPVDDYLRCLDRAHPNADDRTLTQLVWVDRYRRIAVEMARATTDVGAPAWLYRFDQPTSIMDGVLGATHGSDVPYLFNAFAGDRPGAVPMHDPGDPVAAALAARWSATVVAFVRTGHPGDSLAGWPTYDDDRRPCLRVAPDPEIVDDLDHPHSACWPEG